MTCTKITTTLSLELCHEWDLNFELIFTLTCYYLTMLLINIIYSTVFNVRKLHHLIIVTIITNQMSF
jgi:hypothetical protein